MAVNRSVLLWSLAQVAAVAQSMVLFFILAPWLGAYSRKEAIALFGKAVPENCDAIAMNHGHLSCLPWGTVASNPWGFAGCTALLAATVLFLGLSHAKGKGLFSADSIGKVNRTWLKIGIPGLSAEWTRAFVAVVLFLGVLATIMVAANLISHVNS